MALCTLVLIVVFNLCSCFDTDPVVIEKLAQLEERLQKQEILIQHQQELILKQQDQIHLLEETVKTETRCSPCDIHSSPDQTRVQRKVSRQVESVAFSAFLDHSIDHLGIDHPIVYNKVILNEGAVYNEHSGIFTCPMDGVYVIFFSVSTNGRHQIVAKLVVDGTNLVDAVSDTVENYHEAQGSNMVVKDLKQGQQLWVANYRWGNQTINDSNTYRFATFSAFLLHF